MSPDAADLQAYYLQEIEALRSLGTEFARRHPKVAAALDLGRQESKDPHTERLIESFAFLTARLQRDLDREFPRVAQGLIENLCPALMQPVPSMSIARFDWTERAPGAATGILIPRHTGLSVRADQGAQLRFRTAWPVTVMPLSVIALQREEPGQFSLVLQCMAGAQLNNLPLSELEFFIQGPGGLVSRLLDLLIAGQITVSAGNDPSRLRALPAGCVKLMGLDEAETALPIPAGSHPGYLLLNEYFCFPQKFQFLKRSGIDRLALSGEQFYIRFELGPAVEKMTGLDVSTFQLGCVPIVNLFTRTTEPLVIDGQSHEQLLVADREQEAATEIHSISRVTLTPPESDKVIRIAPFGAMSDENGSTDDLFWVARRDHSLRTGLTGTDVFIGFVNQAKQPQLPAAPVVFAQALCTNRGLAEQIPAGIRLTVEAGVQGLGVTLLVEPSVQKNPPIDGDAAWRLTRLLTLNHGSLVSGPEARQRLQELLYFFCSSARRDTQQIAALLGVRTHPTAHRLTQTPWPSFVSGTQIRLDIDPKAFTTSSWVIFSGVLSRFFSLYTTLNSFTQTSVYRGDDCLMHWPAATGYQELV